MPDLHCIIFSKRDIGVFESVMILVASQWGVFLAYDVVLQCTERKGSSNIH